MENREVYRLDIDRKIEIFNIHDKDVESQLTIGFESGPIINFGSHHNQDCCESVYADYSVLEHHREELIGKDVSSISIKGVDEMGFLMCFESGGWRGDVKVFVPCYNYQNGYYSSDLYLVVDNGGVETKVDISNLVEDHID